MIAPDDVAHDALRPKPAVYVLPLALNPRTRARRRRAAEREAQATLLGLRAEVVHREQLMADDAIDERREIRAAAEARAKAERERRDTREAAERSRKVRVAAEKTEAELYQLVSAREQRTASVTMFASVIAMLVFADTGRRDAMLDGLTALGIERPESPAALRQSLTELLSRDDDETHASIETQIAGITARLGEGPTT